MLWSEDKMISLVNVNKMEDINLDDLQCQIVIHPTCYYPSVITIVENLGRMLQF
jgi:hypothetical protein